MILLHQFYVRSIDLPFNLKCCLGKNSVICSNCTGNKVIIVIMASKMAYKVCICVNGQQSIIHALTKNTWVLKGQWLRWGLLSAPSLELEGSLPPLQCQVEAIVSSIPGRVFPVIFRVRFCIAVKASTAWFPWKLVWVPTVSLGPA